MKAVNLHDLFQRQRRQNAQQRTAEAKHAEAEALGVRPVAPGQPGKHQKRSPGAHW